MRSGRAGNREGTFVIESNDLFVTLQEFVADKLTENLTTDLNLRQIEDLWKNRVNKGGAAHRPRSPSHPIALSCENAEIHIPGGGCRRVP